MVYQVPGLSPEAYCWSPMSPRSGQRPHFRHCLVGPPGEPMPITITTGMLSSLALATTKFTCGTNQTSVVRTRRRRVRACSLSDSFTEFLQHSLYAGGGRIMDALGTRAGHAVMIGAVIATPLIASIVLWRNWRWVFFITGRSRPAVGACMALIGFRPVWGLCGAKVLSDSAWYC
jgi:hypothetical protein